MTEFEADLLAVIKALAGPYEFLGGKAIWNVILFSPSDYTLADNDSRRIIRGQEIVSSLPNVILAAARLAYEDSPTVFQDQSKRDRVLKRISDVRQPGTRFLGGEAKPPGQETEKRIEEYDRVRGSVLLRMLRSNGLPSDADQ
jgi:hypothetical protein